MVYEGVGLRVCCATDVSFVLFRVSTFIFPTQASYQIGHVGSGSDVLVNKPTVRAERKKRAKMTPLVVESLYNASAANFQGRRKQLRLTSRPGIGAIQRAIARNFFK